MKKSALSLLLAFLMILSVLPISVSAADVEASPVAADTVISEAKIAAGAAPAAGNTPSYSWSVHTFDEKKFRIKSNAWYNLTDGSQMLRTSTFVNTKTYALYFELEAKDGCIFDDAANIETGFYSMIDETTHVVYNLDNTYKTIGIYFTFRMSGDTDSCILQFLPNGGFGAKRPVVTAKGKAYTLPANSFTAPTGGYFKTWDAGEAGDSFNVTKDTDVTALWSTVLIDSVGINLIESPCWKHTMSYAAINENLVGSGYELNTDYDDGLYIKNGIEWRTYNHNRISVNTSISNGDTQYYVTVYLKAKTLKWFNDPSKMTATVNGRTAKAEKDVNAENDSKYITITYGFPKQVSSLFVNVDEPVVNQRPSYTPNVDNDHFAKLDKSMNDSYFTNGVYWLDLNTRKVMQPTDTFVEGHAYRVVVAITGANGYEFPTKLSVSDYQLHTLFPEIKVNGIEVKRTDSGYGDFASSGYRPEEKAWVACDFPAVVDNTTKIEQADVSVTEPAAGEHPALTGTAGEKGYQVKSVEWIDVATGSSLSASAAFAAGREYTVKVTAVADDGWSFAPDVYATINGRGTNADVSEDRTELVMYYTFPPCEDGSGYVIGDADADGKITILDATAIQRTLASLPVASFDEKAADADEDTKLTILDATAIQRHLAALPTNPNIGTTV